MPKWLRKATSAPNFVFPALVPLLWCAFVIVTRPVSPSRIESSHRPSLALFMTRRFYIAFSVLMVAAALPLRAQDGDIPLGDLARSLQKDKPANEVVIDNDNLPIMMDKAQAERLDGKPVFSIDPSGKAFRMTSPDGSCSLSFDARATGLISTPFLAPKLPQDELQKIDGQATVHDGIMQVSLRNGTDWDLKEIVVAVTILDQGLGASLEAATLSLPAEINPLSKAPDTTFLYHLKPTGVADAKTVFEGDLGEDLAQARNWHWALVGARGIPPAAPGSVAQPRLPPPADAAPSSTPASTAAAPAASTATAPAATAASTTTAPAAASSH